MIEGRRWVYVIHIIIIHIMYTNINTNTNCWISRGRWLKEVRGGYLFPNANAFPPLCNAFVTRHNLLLFLFDIHHYHDHHRIHLPPYALYDFVCNIVMQHTKSVETITWKLVGGSAELSPTETRPNACIINLI